MSREAKVSACMQCKMAPARAHRPVCMRWPPIESEIQPADPSLARRFSDTARAPMMIRARMHASSPMTTRELRRPGAGPQEAGETIGSAVGLQLPTSSSSLAPVKHVDHRAGSTAGYTHTVSHIRPYRRFALVGSGGTVVAVALSPRAVRVHSRVAVSPRLLVRWSTGCVVDRCSQSASSACNLQ
jgi:hypothetical protein